MVSSFTRKKPNRLQIWKIVEKDLPLFRNQCEMIAMYLLSIENSRFSSISLYFSTRIRRWYELAPVGIVLG